MAFNWLKNKKKVKSDPIDKNARAEIEAGQSSASAVLPPRGQGGDSDPSPPAAGTENKGFFTRLKRGLSKTRDFLNTDIEDLFKGKHHIDDDMLEEIEELLITSDIGIQTAEELITSISRQSSSIKGPQDLRRILKQEILALLGDAVPEPVASARPKPHVSMIVGVNGVGKTTTIGKLAAKHVREEQTVLIAAADTFRAAAVEQLAVWAERAGADFVRHKENADPAAVAYDAIEAALARSIDRVFIDTAGRLHTKVNLMEELKKILRTIRKKVPEGPHEILLVLDATTGQNAVSQAKMFHEALGITGLALTKLDGTAKGGIVISICRQLNLPLRYIGVGEDIEDLQPFDAKRFVDALF